MSADTITNPVAPQTESKSARKKRAKAESTGKAKEEASPSTPSLESPAGELATNGTSGEYESAYLKELQKNARNVNKKLNSMSKLDAILKEHEGTSLDDLIAQRKINADQKAQAMKKPGLQAQLADLEQQIAQYKKVDADYQAQLSSQRDALTTAHQSEVQQLKEELQRQTETDSKATLREKLLIFSQFLRAAAAKRAIEEEADTEESKAFEGALLLVYGGDERAVDAAMNLIEGADEPVPSVEGTILSVKYSQVKQSAVSFGPFPGEEVAAAEETTEPASTVEYSEAAPSGTLPDSDPTIAYAGLTEVATGQANGLTGAEEPLAEPIQGSTDDAHANAAGESQWDNNGTSTGGELDESFEMVPRNPSETDSPHEPAPPNATTSWADETTPTTAASGQLSNSSTPAPENDGFHEVERRGRGGHQRGGHDGRGRGRGRGGFNRGRGSFRGRGGERGKGRGGAGAGAGAPQQAPVRS